MGLIILPNQGGIFAGAGSAIYRKHLPQRRKGAKKAQGKFEMKKKKGTRARCKRACAETASAGMAKKRKNTARWPSPFRGSGGAQRKK